MKNLTLILVIASSSLLFCNKAEASFQSDVTNCLKINNSDDRLDCYDTVVKYYKLNPSTAKSITNIAVDTSAPKPLLVNPISSSTPDAATVVPKPDTAPEKASATDRFGQSDADESVESIRSKIVGQFSGWEKGMILELENGQKWRVTSTGRGYKKMDNPIITISRGVFGSFNAKVDGLNTGAKVKRIK